MAEKIYSNFSKINDNFMAEKIVSYLKFTQFSRIFSELLQKKYAP